MTDHNSLNTGFDDAIDDTVRGMMDVDPRPGLRRRVLSQLGSPVQASAWMPRLFAPLGGVACLVAVIFVLTIRQDPGPVVTTAPPVAPAVPPVAVAQPEVTAGPAVERTTPSPSSRPRKLTSPSAIFGPRTARVSAASVASSSVEAVAASAGGEPPSALNPLPPLVLPGLVIPPLDLPALTPVKKE
jgi:hypothetical protein